MQSSKILNLLKAFEWSAQHPCVTDLRRLNVAQPGPGTLLKMATASRTIWALVVEIASPSLVYLKTRVKRTKFSFLTILCLQDLFMRGEGDFVPCSRGFGEEE